MCVLKADTVRWDREPKSTALQAHLDRLVEVDLGMTANLVVQDPTVLEMELPLQMVSVVLAITVRLAPNLKLRWLLCLVTTRRKEHQFKLLVQRELSRT